jgi:hypothetical protein
MMLDNTPSPKAPPRNPTAEGARARAEGRNREPCPYPLDSEERHEWVEGYDGVESEGAPLVTEPGPMPRGPKGERRANIDYSARIGS